MSYWTEENIAVLRCMWDNKRSAVQIAVALNCGSSRSAILGKVHRLGLSRSVKARAEIARGQVHKLGRPKFSTPRPLVRKLKRTEPISVIAAAVAVPITCLMITCDELNDATCRWPVGDPRAAAFRYCGSPKHVRSSYCTGHGGLAYVPSDTRSVRDHHLRRLA